VHALRRAQRRRCRRERRRRRGRMKIRRRAEDRAAARPRPPHELRPPGAWRAREQAQTRWRMRGERAEARRNRARRSRSMAHARNGVRPKAAGSLGRKVLRWRLAWPSRSRPAVPRATPSHERRPAPRDARRPREPPVQGANFVSCRAILAVEFQLSRKTARGQPSTRPGATDCCTAQWNRVDMPQATRFNWSGHLTRAPPRNRTSRRRAPFHYP